MCKKYKAQHENLKLRWTLLPHSPNTDTNSDPSITQAELTRSRQPAEEDSKKIKGKFGQA